MSRSDLSDREFEVGTILNHRKKAGRTEYFIRWKEFGPEEDSWEPLTNLGNCRDLVAHYNRVYLTPVTPGTSSSTLSSRPVSIKMPAKVRSRSRSSSRSRISTTKKTTSSKRSPSKSPSRNKSPSRKSSRSPSRKSSNSSTVTKTSVTKRPGSPGRPSRSPGRPSRSASSQSSELTRIPLKVSALSLQYSDEEFEEPLKLSAAAAQVQHSEVLVQSSWSSSRSGKIEGRGRRGREIEDTYTALRNRGGAELEPSFSSNRGLRQIQQFSDDDEDDNIAKDVVDNKDSEASSWFGQKRQEMIRSFQSRSSTSSVQHGSAIQRLGVKEGSSWWCTLSRPVACFGLRSTDLPIIVFIACLLIIGITFLIEEYF